MAGVLLSLIYTILHCNRRFNCLQANFSYEKFCASHFQAIGNSVMALDNIELCEIRTRNRREPNDTEKVGGSKKIHFLEHCVEKDDSLPKLSLKYGCTVSELKQANSIYNEHEFHARKFIRIPVDEHSVLWEHFGKRNSNPIISDKVEHFQQSRSEGSFRQLRETMIFSAGIAKNGISSADNSFPDNHQNSPGTDVAHDGSDETQCLLSEDSRRSSLDCTTTNVCEEYLNLVDKDIQHVSKRVQSKTDIVDIGAHSLTYIQPSISNNSGNEVLGQAGWFGYKGVIIVLCTVSVLLPLLYVLYFLLFKNYD